ncbi:MAG: hypothetical protein IT581_03645 [Verrucomicrobiales bacterium]|nr:hypothetical protein [Verrucomicrobiales bacterium]
MGFWTALEGTVTFAPGEGAKPRWLTRPAGAVAHRELFLQQRRVLFFFNWLFDYLVNHRGLKALEGGFYAMAPWMAGAAGALLGGLACDRLTRRVGVGRGCRWPAMAGLVLSGILIVAAGLAGNPILAVVLSACLACAWFPEASYWTATIAVSGPDAFVAGGVLNTVLERLRAEMTSERKASLFATLRPFLSDSAGAISYAEAAARIGLSEAATRQAVRRLRVRYRDLLREEVAQTVASPYEVEDELRLLLSAFG